MAIPKTPSTLRLPSKSLSSPLLSDSARKVPVYLRIPWIGKPSTNLEKFKTAVESCYGSVNTRLVFTSKRMLPVARKNVLPTTQKSFVIYEYKRHCDSRYVGRASQRLQDRIKQHVPQWLRNNTEPDCDSPIGQYLLDNNQCAVNYDNERFSILAAALSILIS